MYDSRFFDFFPPPRFLLMPAVGITISDRSIRFAELIPRNGSCVLGRYGETDVPEGVVVNGEIHNEEVLKNLLSRLKKENNLTFVRMSLPEQQGYLITLRLPRMRKKRIRGSIELQLEEHVPISPQSAIFDYKIVKCHPPASASGYIDVGVSVISENTASNYLSLLEGAGLIPLSFEIEAEAIARALLRDGDCGTYMIIDIGATRTGLFIVSHGIIRFTWTIEMGGDLLTEAVSDALHTDFKTAKKQKEKRGLVQSKNGDDLFRALTPILEGLCGEINKRYIYWHTHEDENSKEHNPPVEKIVLCGGESNVPGLPNYIASGLKAQVVLANPWQNIVSFSKYIPEIPFRHSLRYVTSLGLAMRFPR